MKMTTHFSPMSMTLEKGKTMERELEQNKKQTSGCQGFQGSDGQKIRAPVTSGADVTLSCTLSQRYTGHYTRGGSQSAHHQEEARSGQETLGGEAVTGASRA